MSCPSHSFGSLALPQATSLFTLASCNFLFHRPSSYLLPPIGSFLVVQTIFYGDLSCFQSDTFLIRLLVLKSRVSSNPYSYWPVQLQGFSYCSSKNHFQLTRQ